MSKKSVNSPSSVFIMQYHDYDIKFHLTKEILLSDWTTYPSWVGHWTKLAIDPDELKQSSQV
jgi:hypothetical protein